MNCSGCYPLYVSPVVFLPVTPPFTHPKTNYRYQSQFPSLRTGLRNTCIRPSASNPLPLVPPHNITTSTLCLCRFPQLHHSPATFMCSTSSPLIRGRFFFLLSCCECSTPLWCVSARCNGEDVLSPLNIQGTHFSLSHPPRVWLDSQARPSTSAPPTCNWGLRPSSPTFVDEIARLYEAT